MKEYMSKNFILYFSKDDTTIVIGEVLISEEMHNLIMEEVEERSYASFVKFKDGELVFNVEVFGRLGLEKTIM
jgi:hypothetical protein